MIAKRKRLRIKDFDYSSQNYYFVTICTDKRTCIFGDIDSLNYIGKIVDIELQKVSEHFPNVKIDKYVVMPNHIHAIIVIGCEERTVGNGLGHSKTKGSEEHQTVGNGLDRSEKTPTLSQIIGLYKSGVSRQVHNIYPDLMVWQKSFYDHIIRNEKEYQEIWKYIDENPLQWVNDEYYV